MNKNQCQLCKGYGIIKNTDYSCDFCDGIRCDNVPKNYIYTPYVECKKCFNNYSCPNCSINLVYHKKKKILLLNFVEL